jgi:hypothetical protein
MSKYCSKCKAGEKTSKAVAHNPSLCARNYHGSYKGMEAHGALQSCVHLHQNHNMVYEIILKWIFVDALEARLINQIPTTPVGNKKVDNGQLALTHPPI